MKKRVIIFLAMLLSLLIAAAPIAAAAEAAAEAVAEGGESGRVWNADIRLSITRERQLRQEAGMDLDAWDAAMDQVKQSGLQEAITREALLAADADATILEENGKVYQLVPSSLFGPVTDVLSAYRLGYRLIGLLGAPPGPACICGQS